MLFKPKISKRPSRAVTPQRLMMQNGSNHPCPNRSSAVKSVKYQQRGGFLTRRHPGLFVIAITGSIGVVIMVLAGPLPLSFRHQDDPVNERVHQDKHVGDCVEEAKVETLAGVNRGGGGRHFAQQNRLPRVGVLLVEVGVVEMGEAPALDASQLPCVKNLRPRNSQRR